jgi:hypothetical protein
LNVHYVIDKRGKRIAVETLPMDDVKPKASGKKFAQGKRFVTISAEQDHRLNQVTSATALHIFRRLLFLAPYGKRRSEPFELPAAATFGFNRDQRHRALVELEKCGLISVQRRQGRPSLITLLHEHGSE